MRLALTALIVRDYDEAIRWYTEVLGFRLAKDEDLGGGKRWVEIVDEAETGLLLAMARKPEEVAAIGNQHAGRVAYFLHVQNFDATYRQLSDNGVTFDEAPRDEPYGKVVVFRDLYGNRWDLIEPAKE